MQSMLAVSGQKSHLEVFMFSEPILVCGRWYYENPKFLQKRRYATDESRKDRAVVNRLSKPLLSAHHHRRRSASSAGALLQLVACLGLAFGPLGCARNSPPPNPPVHEVDSALDDQMRPRTNVVLISIDTLRADHLSAYGYEFETTPNIDRVAEEGVLFENAIAETSWTLPAHASMLTGLPSLVHQVVFDGKRLTEGHTTLAEVLSAAGYRTRAYVSGPYLHPIFGFDQGFETYEVIGETIYDEPGFSFERLESDPALQLEFAEREIQSDRNLTSGEIADAVVGDLEAVQDAPFFLFLHFFDVHFDYIPPDAYQKKFYPDYPGSLDANDYATNPKVNAEMSPEDLRYVTSLYDGEILWTDEHIGRIMDALDEAGLHDNTLVVITSDHGEEFFEHGNKGHRYTLFDEQLLVPLVLRLPGTLPPGLRIPDQVRTIDLMPTILDIVGIPTDALMLGRSVLPLIDADSSEEERPALSYLLWPESYEITSLRWKNRKIISRLAVGETRPQVLFVDLVTNPQERKHPVSPEDREAIKTMFARMRELQKEEIALGETLEFSPAEDVELPAEMREALEKLGYVQE